MADQIRVGVMGAGWPGASHARGCLKAGGFKILAVADLIPQRRQKMIDEFGELRQYTDAMKMLDDPEIDAVSICLPTHLHAPLAIAALRAGKHVVCEKPPAINVEQARKMQLAAEKAKKVLLYGVQRRFGGAEQAAKQAIEKGYLGDVFHIRAQWLRTRGMPIGTGWYAIKEQSGGGALIDCGTHMLDLAWHLLGQPNPESAFGVTYQKFGQWAPKDVKIDVEDSAFALVRFEGGKSVELSVSWALAQPPQQHGTVCRVYGDKAALDVHTPEGAVLYRNFDEKGQAKATPLKPPKTVGHAAMMRHFRDCIVNKTKPLIGPAEGVAMMSMLGAIYRSAETGKSVPIKARE